MIYIGFLSRYSFIPMTEVAIRYMNADTTITIPIKVLIQKTTASPAIAIRLLIQKVFA